MRKRNQTTCRCSLHQFPHRSTRACFFQRASQEWERYLADNAARAGRLGDAAYIAGGG